MINKTDLRIGNSVMLFLGIDDYGAQFRIVKIFGINSDKIGDVKIRIDDTGHWHSLDNIHPIPITEEALVKHLKFTKINEKLFCKGRLIVAIQDNRAFFTDDITVINLDGIHHLQNIFYFKHQTELTYEPTH